MSASLKGISFFNYSYVNLNRIYGSALKRGIKNVGLNEILVLHHHVLSTRLHLTRLLTPLHTNGSLEAHNVTALV